MTGNTAHEKIRKAHQIDKVPTGIPGLDDITHGGLPAGRPTLISGGPGSGKTLLGISFLVEGAERFQEPGVLLTFEESADELAQDRESAEPGVEHPDWTVLIHSRHVIA
jgi:circadian clock protein KaiC